MDIPQSIDQLNERFAVGDALRFEPGGGGLPCAAVRTELCTGRVYLHGAHVTGFTPAGCEPVLFMSSQTDYEPGKAIRGGVPVCFPWFGPHPSDPSQPSHGPARLTAWRLEAAGVDGDSVTLELAADFEPYHVRHRVVFGRELSMTLEAHNRSDVPASFEAALHTYLAVSDAAAVGISGLEGVDYLDKADGGRRKRQANAPIRFTGETDRVYVDTPSACALTDPGLGRRVTVEKSGSASTVVWNPWVEKAAALSDLGDDDWVGMVCIETANAGPNAVSLAAGQPHEMNATVSLARF
jgi:glucose-6-phosphate 1-epimerase